MAGLADTVAELLSRTRAASLGAGVSGEGAELRPVTQFGSNPGALRMWLHVPEGLTAKAPLVVVLHGCGQTAAGYAAGAGWLATADRYGFAVLCPEQVGSNNANLCFNWFEEADIRRGGGEAESVAQMLRRAVADLDLDGRRVFITGLSAGGAMAAVMLAAYPETFAAGVIIAGLPYGAVHAATRSAALPGASERHTHTAWSRPDGSVVVALHRIAGLGHGAPIAANGVDECGTPAPWILEAGLSSTREIARPWGLLKDKRRAAAPEPSSAAKALDGAAAGVRRTTVATGGSDFSPRAADDEDLHNVHGLTRQR